MPAKRSTPPASALDILRREMREQAEHWLARVTELEQTLERYVTVFEQAPVGLVNIDASGVVLELNAEASALFGTTRAAALGRPLICFLDRGDLKRAFKHFVDCARGDRTTEVRLRRPNGATEPAQLLTRAVWSDTDHGYTYHTVITPTSARRLREAALRASEQRHRQIIETANEGICIVDRENRIVFANRRLGVMVGARVDELIGRSAYELVPAEDLATATRAFDARETGPGGRTDERLRRLDGTALWTSISTTIMTGEAGEFAGMIRMYTDASERRQLADAREALMRQLVAAQEAERQRIARELHDQMGQHVVALSLGVAQLSRLAGDVEGAKPILEQLTHASDLLGRDVHTLALELRPSALDHLGLSVALSSYAENVAARTNLEIDVHCDDITPLGVSGAVQTGLYRIAQEALTNVVKHAQATRVSVILEVGPDGLLLIVEDDGTGMNEGAGSSSATTTLGISGMRERANLLGGTLSIESSRGRGTTIYARVPIATLQSEDDHEQTTPAAARR
jgi:PAS domain S-box-containing protein